MGVGVGATFAEKEATTFMVEGVDTETLVDVGTEEKMFVETEIKGKKFVVGAEVTTVEVILLI